jgi:hypothetical protein
VLNRNRAVRITAFSPHATTLVLTPAEDWQFSIVPFDPDAEDTLSICWYLDDVKVAEGEPHYLYRAGSKPAGSYRVRVEVSDGNTTAAHEWVLKIEAAGIAAEQQEWRELLYAATGLLTLLLLLLGGVAAIIARRRQREKAKAELEDAEKVEQRQLILDAVRKRPGLHAQELAARLGIPQQRLAELLEGLAHVRLLRKDATGRLYYIVGSVMQKRQAAASVVEWEEDGG